MKPIIKKQFLTNNRRLRLFYYLQHLAYSGIFTIKQEQKVRDIVICGLPRSGSTLLTNITKELLDIDNHLYFDDEKEYIKIIQDRSSPLIRKTHRYNYTLGKRISSGKTIGLFTYRDIRDVVVSMHQKKWFGDMNNFITSNFFREMGLSAILYDTTPNINTFYYKDLLNYKEKVIINLSKILKQKLTPNKLDQIINKTSIEYVMDIVNKDASEFDNGPMINTSLGYHHNHIQDPSINKWKVYLDQKQQHTILIHIPEFFKHFGY